MSLSHFIKDTIFVNAAVSSSPSESTKDTLNPDLQSVIPQASSGISIVYDLVRNAKS